MFFYKKQTTNKLTTIYVEHNKNKNNPQCIPEKPVQGQIPSCTPLLQGFYVEGLRKNSQTTQAQKVLFYIPCVL